MTETSFQSKFYVMPQKANIKLHKLIQRLLTIGNPKQFNQFLQSYHEVDIAEALEKLKLEQRITFLKKFTPEDATLIIEEMDIQEQIKLLSKIKINQAVEFVGEMETDNAADLLEELYETNEDKADEILDALPDEEAEDLEKILSYEEETAGTIMSTDFVIIPENLTVQKAIEEIKRQEPPNSEATFYVYVVNDKKQLVGFTTLQKLILATPRTRITTIRKENPIYCNVTMDQEDVAKLIQKYSLIAIPVVNKKRQVVGIITVDDIVDVVVEEATEDLYLLSGTADADEQKLLQGNPSYAIKSRLPWLILSIFGGLVASYIITTYSQIYNALENKPFSLALSLSFLPLLMALGGNVGGQSATIVVRGLSTGTIEPKNTLKLIFRELLIGCILGAIIGALVLIFNWNFNLKIVALIVPISILLNMTVATLIGTLIPLFFKRISIDPAVASAPFISSTLDLIGQLIYFTLTVQAIIWLS